MFKRKLSDIPRLKFGFFQADDMKDTPAIHTQSPYEPPKSVRPPLPPSVDADLYAACAYVVQSLKYGSGHPVDKPRLDRPAVKQSVNQNKIYRPKAKSKPHLQHAEPSDLDGMPYSNQDRDLYRYKPDVALEDIFDDHDKALSLSQRNAQIRVDQLMGARPAAATLPPMPRKRAESSRTTHSSSNPGHELATSKAGTEGSRTMKHIPTCRQDSLETSTTSPNTDPTRSPWSEKDSTAITSAELTPLRDIRRMSSQAMTSGVESSSLSKIEAAEAEWMASKLEQPKEIVEEPESVAINPSIRRELDPQSRAGQQCAALPSTTAASQQGSNNTRQLSSASRPTRQRASSDQNMKPRSESRQARSRTPVDVQLARSRDFSATRAPKPLADAKERTRSIGHGIREYFRPSSPHRRTGDAPRLTRSASYDTTFHSNKSSTQSREKVAALVDTNRCLPPLPGLDKWKPVEVPRAPESSKNPLKPEVSKETLPSEPEKAHISTVPGKPIKSGHIVSQIASTGPRPVISGHMLSSRSTEPKGRVRKMDSLAHLDNPYLTDTPELPASTAQHVGRGNETPTPATDALPTWDTYDFRPTGTPSAMAKSNTAPRGMDGKDYEVIHTHGYQHTVELSPTSSMPLAARASPIESEKASRWKWWQMNKADERAKRREQQQSKPRRRQQKSDWKDEVVRSGSHSGILVTDEFSPEAPILRY